MVTLEQVEKLCERANVSYDEAKAMLEETNGDLLEAVIKLEKEGRIKAPEGNGYFNSKNSQPGIDTVNNDKKAEEKSAEKEGISFGESVNNFFKWCGRILHIGNTNSFEVKKDGNRIMVLPVTILALLLLFAFWITIPILIIGSFFGYKYLFSGKEMKKTQVNRAMDSVADAAEDFKKKVIDYKDDKPNGKNTDN